MFSLLYQVGGNSRGIRTSFPANPEQPLQFLLLFFDQLKKLYAESKPMLVVPHLTFQIKPVAIGE